MLWIKHTLLLMLILSQGNFLKAQRKLQLFENKYLEITGSTKSFYLINANSPRMDETFPHGENETLYFLVFDWRYKFLKSGLFYGDTIIEQRTFHSYRCPACPVYIPLIVKSQFPDKILFYSRLDVKTDSLSLSGIENEAGQLLPLVDDYGIILWKTLPEKLW